VDAAVSVGPGSTLLVFQFPRNEGCGNENTAAGGPARRRRVDIRAGELFCRFHEGNGVPVRAAPPAFDPGRRVTPASVPSRGDNFDVAALKMVLAAKSGKPLEPWGNWLRAGFAPW